LQKTRDPEIRQTKEGMNDGSGYIGIERREKIKATNASLPSTIASTAGREIVRGLRTTPLTGSAIYTLQGKASFSRGMQKPRRLILDTF